MKVGVCISGGGAKIGFAVGVLKVMKDKGIKIDLAYGISSGSICTAALCYGSLDKFEEILKGINKRDDVLTTQLCKVIRAQLTGWGNADGVFEMDTMRQKLNDLELDKPQIKGVVGYVSLQSGKIEYKDSDSLSKTEFLNAVQASCSAPVAMQSQRIGGHDCVDGGVRDVLPLRALIRDPMKVDEIHVICLSPLDPFPTAKEYKNIIDVAERTLDLTVNEVLNNDYNFVGLVNKLIPLKHLLGRELQSWLANKRDISRFRYLPTEDICGTLEFCRENIEKGIAHGEQVASDVLKNYP